MMPLVSHRSHGDPPPQPYPAPPLPLEAATPLPPTCSNLCSTCSSTAGERAVLSFDISPVTSILMEGREVAEHGGEESSFCGDKINSVIYDNFPQNFSLLVSCHIPSDFYPLRSGEDNVFTGVCLFMGEVYSRAKRVWHREVWHGGIWTDTLARWILPQSVCILLECIYIPAYLLYYAL